MNFQNLSISLTHMRIVDSFNKRGVGRLTNSFPNLLLNNSDPKDFKVPLDFTYLMKFPILFTYFLVDGSYYLTKKLCNFLPSFKIPRARANPKYPISHELSETELINSLGRTLRNFRIEVTFLRLRGIDDFGLLEAICVNDASIEIEIRYYDSELLHVGNYHFSKHFSVRETKKFLVGNLISVVCEDLKRINSGINQLNSSIQDCRLEQTKNAKELKVSDILNLMWEKYLKKQINLFGSSKFETDWKVLIKFEDRKIATIESPRGRWFADPHLRFFDFTYFLFVEDFDVKAKKGRISILTIQKQKISQPEIIVEKSGHVSFPQTFIFENELWLSMESHVTGGVPLYKLDSEEGCWKECSTQIPQYHLVDPIIFQNEGVWYLIATQKTSVGEDYYSKLVMFHAHDPISNSWKFFSGNPLKFDATTGRNAGLFRSTESWIRVAQEYRGQTYGKSLSFQEIVQISEFSYKEVPFEVKMPNLPPRISRIHTYTEAENIVALDAKFYLSIT